MLTLRPKKDLTPAVMRLDTALTEGDIMRKVVTALAACTLATAGLLGVSTGVAAAAGGGAVVQLHPPKCC